MDDNFRQATLVAKPKLEDFRKDFHKTPVDFDSRVKN